MSEGSIAFDRAAEFYDRTRGADAAATAATAATLAEELRGRSRVLEVGVGTGLLALPLRQGGVNVIGLDISAPMLAKLVEKADGQTAPVVLGDATDMPFADDAVDGAYLRWVLHLIPHWRGLLAEVVRVVAPGGVFLANLGAYDPVSDGIKDHFGELVGRSLKPVGLDWGANEELDSAMASHGTRVRLLESVVEVVEEPLGQFLDGIRDNLYSWTWPVPEADRLRAAEALRPWAEERFGDLDAPRRYEVARTWRAYDLP
jgi:SAM-dependent methyltransferase